MRRKKNYPISSNSPKQEIKPVKKAILVFSVFVIVGVVLDMTSGDNFVLMPNYEEFLWRLLFLVVLPVSLICCFPFFQNNRIIENQSVTGRMRQLMRILIMAIVMSSFIGMSVFGWSAFAGWTTANTPAIPMLGKILSVGRISGKGGGTRCHHFVRFFIGELNTNGTLCFDDYIDDDYTPQVGDVIILIGRSSKLGFYIDDVRQKT